MAPSPSPISTAAPAWPQSHITCRSSSVSGEVTVPPHQQVYKEADGDDRGTQLHASPRICWGCLCLPWGQGTLLLAFRCLPSTPCMPGPEQLCTFQIGQPANCLLCRFWETPT